MADTVHDAHFVELDPQIAYRILALRVDIFVVEQSCAYRELDGRDLEESARQLWVERAGEVIATARMLREPDGSVRIGRVATARSARSQGIGARLMQRALVLAEGRDVVLDAQSYLAAWYEAFGFVRTGEEFVEDAIAHVPMRRPSR